MKQGMVVPQNKNSLPIKEDNTESESSGFFSWVRNSFFSHRNDTTVREVIEELIEEDELEDSPSVASHERTLISNILELRDLPVIDVMVPRIDITAVNINTTSKKLFKILKDKPHTRLPVYEDNMDNIVGSIHMKDVLIHAASEEEFNIKSFLRTVLVVSPAMRVLALLLKMRQSRVHLALVVDEFGGIDGLITINDLIEAIVGEIDDEHDLDIQPQMIVRPDGTVLIDARYELEELEKHFGTLWTEEEHEDSDTLGGLINDIAGHVPSRGEIIEHPSGIVFEITDADPRRINRIRVHNLPEIEQEDDNNDSNGKGKGKGNDKNTEN